MKQLLITGGTVFVSKYTADYFQKAGYEVYVLNRNTKKQVEHVHLIQADRHSLGDALKDRHFDAVIDVCAYRPSDIRELLDGLSEFPKDYIFISSSAVYPADNPKPFREEQPIGFNAMWKDYSTGKVEAERYLLSRFPQAYILRPPYLYGPMQNLYREPFVFECALAGRKFYIPKDGKMKLQFFHIEDLCRLMQILLTTHPRDHILNVGNPESVDINRFVELCYKVADADLEKVFVHGHENQRDYFPFHDYEYSLDLTKQNALLPQTKDLEEGLQESLEWYLKHPDEVARKNYISFIDQVLAK